MSNELLIGIKIGATVAGSFASAIGSTKRSIDKLGSSVTQLTSKQERLGQVMGAAMMRPTRSVENLTRSYEKLGNTIRSLQVQQQKLNSLIKRQDTLRNEHKETRGRLIETAAQTAVIAAPVVKSIVSAANFQDQIKDISITAGFSKKEESDLSQNVRLSSLKYNQTTSEINSGVGVLVAGNISSSKELQKYSGEMAKAATATRASMEDLGNSALALKNSFNIGADGIGRAYNIMAAGGKEGQFELKDQAKWLPQLAPALANLGFTGEKGLAQTVSMMQTARTGASSSDMAGNNIANFLGKITSADTIKSFGDAGINIEGSIKNLASKGLSATDAMLTVVEKYIGTKGPDAVKKFTDAINIKDEKQRQAAVEKISEAYKLSDLFRDRQVLDFLRPALANRGRMKEIENISLQSANKDINGQDLIKRMKSPLEQWKDFKIEINDISITIGDALIPPIVSLWESLKPVIVSFGQFAKANPEIIKLGIGFIAGVMGVRLLGAALSYGISSLKLFGISVQIAMGTVKAWRLIMNAKIALGSITTASKVIGKLGGVAMIAGRFLASSLVGGLKLVGQAVLWLGRAMLLNPIGLAITVIAGLGYLVYRNWSKIAPWLSAIWITVKNKCLQVWNWISGIFDSGISKVSNLIKLWGIGDEFKKLMDDPLGYLKTLPSRFISAGADLMKGLVNGITGALGQVKDSIYSAGDSVVGWFKEKLGIHSPSRVFMGLGGFIGQGAAIGIDQSSGLVKNSVSKLGQGAINSFNKEPIDSPLLNLSRRVNQTVNHAGGLDAVNQGKSSSGSMVIHFNPTINVNVHENASSMKEQVMQAVQMSQREFEKMFQKMQMTNNRRSYTEV